MPAERIERCCSCCARIPSASLLAFIMLICGLGLVTGSLVAVGERLKSNEILNYNQVYELFKLVIAGLAPSMLVVGVLFLVVSILLSGKTRKMLFWGASRHLCAKILNATMFVFCYLLFIVWFVITCALLYPVLLNAFYKFSDCRAIQQNAVLVTKGLSANNSSCIDAKLLRLRAGANAASGSKICDERKLQLCHHFDEYLLSFGIAFIGSFTVMLSLLHFIVSMSANHAYIRSDNPNYEQENNPNGNSTDPAVIEETKM